MNSIQSQSFNSEMTISDLKTLGSQGGATARLKDGSDVELRPKFGTMQKVIYLNGKRTEALVRLEYSKLIGKIRTIKRHDVLIARRQKLNGHETLVLTGRGYHRKNKN